MIKKVLFGVLSGLLVICAMTFMPSISSILFLSVAVLLLPLAKLQEVLKSIFPRKTLKGLLCTALAVAAIISAPTDTPVNEPEHSNPPVSQQTTESGAMAELPKENASANPESGAQVGIVTSPVGSGADRNSGTSTEPLPGTPSASDDVQPSSPFASGSEQSLATGVAIPTNSTFEIHFIDVGQADAALVLCDGHAMLIDGGNSADSSLIYSYLRNHGITFLDVIVATHGHEDHVGGLSGALNYASVGKAYCSVDSYDSDSFNDFIKYLGKQNKTITVPKTGETFELGSSTVRIVGVNGNAADHNNSSIVLRIEYGETSFLFTGDAEREAEQTILNSGYDLKSTVLKVGHHGSDSSTSYVFLRTVAPKYGVISVGEGNSYGHPTEATLSRLRDADVTVYRTDLQGTIICSSNGKDVSFSVTKNKDADTLVSPNKSKPSIAIPAAPSQSPQSDDSGTDTVEEATGTNYVGNKNTKKFHYDWCGSVGKMKESNKYYYTGTRDEMIAKGYTPCGNCKP